VDLDGQPEKKVKDGSQRTCSPIKSSSQGTFRRNFEMQGSM
jgi:hypothetical protein